MPINDRGINSAQLASSQQAAVSGASNESARRAYEAAAKENLNAQNAEDAATQMYAYEDSRHRNAWILTTARRQYVRSKTNPDNAEVADYTKWDDKNAPLVFNVNPNSYQMDNPFRQQVVETKGGPIIHTFRDPARGYTNFGFATMNIEMSSGSMMPRAKYAGSSRAQRSQQWSLPPSIGNFYRFLEIIQEDTVYTDDSGEILPNYQIIKMSTVLFPRLTLYGFFTANANWSEQAENPAEIQNWQTQFKIYRTSPSLTINEISQLYSKWEKDYNEIYTQLG